MVGFKSLYLDFVEYIEKIELAHFCIVSALICATSWTNLKNTLNKGSFTHESFLKESALSFFLVFYQSSGGLSIVRRELLWLWSRLLIGNALVIKCIKSL